MEYVAAFLGMFVVDFFWAAYIGATSRGHAPAASLFSAAIVFISGSVTMAYIDNRWALVPACLGAFAGTYVAVRCRG